MKYIAFTIALLLGTFNSFSQSVDENMATAVVKGWSLSAGFNAINHIGTRGPLNSPGDWAFKNPISVGAEYLWPTGFAIEQSLTFNGFSEGDMIDGAVLTKDYSYFSTDTTFKYYFGTHIFPEVNWLDLYAGTGFGFFSVDNTNISANLSGGATFWVSDNFGIRIQNVMKFAFDHKNSGFDNNHFQWHLQGIFKL